MGNGGDYRARVVWEDGLSEKLLEDWPEGKSGVYSLKWL